MSSKSAKTKKPSSTKAKNRDTAKDRLLVDMVRELRVMREESGTQVVPRVGALARPLSRPTTFGMRGGRVVLTGCELLQTLQTPGSSLVQGAVLFECFVGASSQSGGTYPSLYNILTNGTVSASGPTTRVGGLMRYWSRYRFKRLRLHYVPRCSVQVSGGVVAGYFADPADYLGVSGTTAFQRVAITHGSRESVVYGGFCVDAKLDNKEDLFVDTAGTDLTSVTVPELRQLFQGVLVVLATGGLPTDTTLGDVYVEYELELQNEELPDVAQAVNSGSSTVQLLGATPASSTASVMMDPYSSSVVLDRTTVLPVGTAPPSWWNNVSKTITQAGTYLLDLGVNSTVSANGQINDSGTYSATPALSDANATYGYNATTGDEVGIFQFAVNTVPYVLPWFYNFASSGATGNFPAQWLSAAISQLAASSAPEQRLAEMRGRALKEGAWRALHRAGDGEQLIQYWGRMAAGKISDALRREAVHNFCQCQWYYCNDGGAEFEGVSWEVLASLLESDLSNDYPTAQALFEDISAATCRVSTQHTCPSAQSMPAAVAGEKKAAHDLLRGYRVHETYVEDSSPRRVEGSRVTASRRQEERNGTA